MKNKNTSASNTVSIANGKLILTLPDANLPVVWQMDLNMAQSSAFTIKDDKKNKTFILVLKTQDGAIDEIAVFDSKDRAVSIMMETSQALQNKTMPEKATQTTKGKADILGAVLALLLIIVLFFIWSVSASMYPRTISNEDNSTSLDSQSSSGVPLSADDFLNNR